MDPIQENNQDDHQTIGNLLKKARTDQNLTLKAIAQHTKINKTILENLENDNLDKLPNKAYLSGFVKSYAKALGIPQHICLDLLSKAYHGDSPHLNTVNDDTSNEQFQDELNNDDPNYSQASDANKQIPVLTYMISFVIIVGGFFVYLQQSDNQDSELPVKAAKVAVPIGTKSLTHQTPLHHKPAPSSESTQKREALSLAASSLNGALNNDTQTPEVSAIASNTNELKLEDSKTLEPAKMNIDKKTAVSSTEQATSTVIKADQIATSKKEEKKITPIKNQDDPKKKKPSKTFYKVNRVLYSFTTSDVEKITEEFLPTKFRAPNLKKDMHSLFVNSINGDTWITYKSDDQPIKKFILKKDRNILINGKVIRMFFGNVNNTKIFFDNRPLDIFSRTGVKSIIFPQENKADFYFPLFVFENDSVLTSDEYMLKTGPETSFLNQN